MIQRPLFFSTLLLSVWACTRSDSAERRVLAGEAALGSGNDAAALQEFRSALDSLEPGPGLYVRARKGALVAGPVRDEPALLENFCSLASAYPGEIRAPDYCAFGERLARLGDFAAGCSVLAAGLKDRGGLSGMKSLVEALRSLAEASSTAPRGHWMLGRTLLQEFEARRDPAVLRLALRSFEDSLGGSQAPDGESVASAASDATPEDRLQANLGQAWCYLWLGLAGESGDFQTPLAIFERVIAVFPDSSEAHTGKGASLTYLGRWEDARAALDRAIELDAGAVEAWLNLGELCLRRKQWDEARGALETALQLRPTSVSTHVWLAAALTELGDTDAATQLLERALELEPESGEVMLQLGAIRARHGEMEEARSWIDRSLNVDPFNGNAHLQRGKVLIALGDLHQAAASLHQASSLLPDSFEAHYNLGVLLANSGATTQATALLRRALEIAPEEPLSDEIRRTLAELEARAPGME